MNAAQNQMTTYFAFSDPHACLQPVLEGLKEAGFDPSNLNHCLIVAGDLFDRGPEPYELYQYVQSLPQVILVKGNHEDCLLDMLRRGYPKNYDFQNKTILTLFQLAGSTYEEACNLALRMPRYGSAPSDRDEALKLFDEAANNPRVQEVVAWIKEKFVNYFETPHHVIIHSSIPLIPNWRNGDEASWYQARWCNPIEEYRHNVYRPIWAENKKVVIGHFHTNLLFDYLDPYHHLDNHPRENTSYDVSPLFDNGSLVGLDACTILSKRINVYQFEE